MATEIRPDPAVPGTFVVIEVALLEITGAKAALLKRTTLFPGVVEKLEPVIVTKAPMAPALGENPVIAGPALTVGTENASLLVADPLELVTAIVPVDAPGGTVATTLVLVEDETVAGTPLKATVF